MSSTWIGAVEGSTFMQTNYEHRQFGLVMLVILIIPVIGLVLALSLAPQTVPPPLPPLIVILGIMLLTMVVFGSMTVKVDAEQVLLFFGLRFVRRSFPLGQITAVRVVRNTLLMGLGIHFIPGGMVYNVSGLDAVEITLQNGRRVRIGTDAPAALARAIEEGRRLHALSG